MGFSGFGFGLGLFGVWGFGVFSAFRAVGLLGFGVGVFRTLGPSNEVS